LFKVVFGIVMVVTFLRFLLLVLSFGWKKFEQTANVTIEMKRH